MDRATDAALRQAAFRWLEEQVEVHGEVLEWTAHLLPGFPWQGQRVSLAGPPGIWKPAGCRWPLSIRTSHANPYQDAFEDEETLAYAFRDRRPDGREPPDNRGLLDARRRQVPLVYLHGVAKGRYLVVWPVFVEYADPVRRRFLVRTGDPRLLDGLRVQEEELQRRYAIVPLRLRIHQQTFRERVLAAYRGQCAICRLRHRELLDAAHIVPDVEPGGEPVVRNGLALCRLHHGAYDRDLIGIRPDRVVQVRRDVLDEEDGPMLRHGLQGIHGQEILVPRRAADRPDPGRLEIRWRRFLQAG